MKSGWFSRKRRREELNDELRAHLDMATEDRVQRGACRPARVGNFLLTAAVLTLALGIGANTDRVLPSVVKIDRQLRAGGTPTFTATVTGSTNQGVTWAIEKSVPAVAPSDWIWERSVTTSPNPDFPS